MIKNPEPLFELAKERGIVAFDNLGFPLKDWINQTALNHFHVAYDEVDNIKQIMACCIVFDFNHPITEKIFDDWVTASLHGGFNNDFTRRDGFRGHRHDQAVLSLLLHLNKVKLNDYGDGFCYHPNQDKYDNVYIINKGIDV